MRHNETRASHSLLMKLGGELTVPILTLLVRSVTLQPLAPTKFPISTSLLNALLAFTYPNVQPTPQAQTRITQTHTPLPNNAQKGYRTGKIRLV